jgi:hypothetical protein
VVRLEPVGIREISSDDPRHRIAPARPFDAVRSIDDVRKVLIRNLMDANAKAIGFASAADYEAFVAAEADDTGALADDIIALGVKAREGGMRLRECTDLIADVFRAPWTEERTPLLRSVTLRTASDNDNTRATEERAA